MIAVDTNVLVHAHRRESAFFEPARDSLAKLSGGRAPWGIPFHCLVELYGIVTHPSIWKTPSTPAQARNQIEVWRGAPGLVVLADEATALEHLLDLVLAAQVRGPGVHDARIAAVCLSHGVTEIWTVDRDFSQFPPLRARKPF
jgi:toxin-antitoxin system PIN domain toxin